MPKEKLLVKDRAIWNPRSLQLLREKSAIRYARKAVPQTVGEINIIFPEIEISLGLHVILRSKRIKGRSLLEMIYDQREQTTAVEMAMIAISALSRAEITSDPYKLFGKSYRLIRPMKAAFSEYLLSSMLSNEQRIKMSQMVSQYIHIGKNERRVLVHGDFHANNMIIDIESRSVGIVDLEMMHTGKHATNFAQLWVSFHIADPLLGKAFYHKYINQFSAMINEQFGNDVRAEVALRCHSLVRDARKNRHVELERKAHNLLKDVIRTDTFANLVLAI